jgi:hypothetical protein
MMRHFYAVVHKDEDSAFGVQFPDLPGCLSLWFEDAGEVVPSTVESVRANAANDLAKGAFLVMVPWIGRNSKPARVNISLDRAMLDAIDSAASMRRLTRSAFLAEAARNEIEGRR